MTLWSNIAKRVVMYLKVSEVFQNVLKVAKKGANICQHLPKNTQLVKKCQNGGQTCATLVRQVPTCQTGAKLMKKCDIT